jgi:hypothetical protein
VTVYPTGNVEPDTGAHVTWTVPSTVSVAVGVGQEAGAPPGPTASLKISGVLLTIGAVVSTVCTANSLGVAGFPAVSVAVHVTVVLPTGNRLPDAGAQLTGSVPSTISVPIGLG